jgi:Ni,Fe-hydrogenase III large subunit
MGRLTEEARRVMSGITGHRFGFGAVNEETAIDYAKLKEFTGYLKKEVEFFEEWTDDMASLWDRYNTTGALSREKAVKYGVVGVAARASGIELDVRNNAFYKKFGHKTQLGVKGEVGDRFKVRIKEILNSVELIQNFETDKNETFKFVEFKDGEYISFTESSIGELFMYLKIKNGLVERFYVRDPSHINWQAFHTTIYKDIIADFPLINKSFDLSYAGNDL